MLKGKWYIWVWSLKIQKEPIFTNTILLVSDEKKSKSSKASSKPTQPRRKPRNEKHIIGFLFSICLLLTIFLGSSLFIMKSLQIPDIRTVANYQPAEASIIYDRHGRVIERVFAENRTVVELEAMHELLPDAFVAAEDGRFYEHKGLDFISVMRALVVNLKSGRKSQGGSTITQQVARGLLLSPEKTYIRKFKEAILAWRIDTLLTKKEILYIYLNQIYLGEGAFGVEAASQVYFGKSASQLTLGEVALLAGLPQAPTRYSPLKHLDRARARQRYVLNRMADDGYITPDKARVAYISKLNLRAGKRGFDPVNGYYLDVVKKQATEILGRPLQEAGARIYTHLDPKLQKSATQAVVSGLRSAGVRQALRDVNSRRIPQGALVCIERSNGRVRALVGGADYFASPFNRAVQAKRPAGSIFKPFVFAAALQDGWKPLSIISDAPLSISGGKHGVWQPKNYSGTYHGDTTLKNALANSYNVAAVRLMQNVGVKRVHAMADASGITAKMPPDLSLALGTVDVSLLEITAAYGPFVNSGIYTEPSFIRRIVVEDKELWRESPMRVQAMTPRTALNMEAMLEEVVTNGTGKRAGGLPGATGGKTGTTDKNRDAWFVGFNGNYISGVWVGHDLNQTLGDKENGGRTAVPIWRDFMAEARGGSAR